jgi:hypothetical protein
MYKNFKKAKKNVQKFQTKKKKCTKISNKEKKCTKNFKLINFSKIFYEKINRLDTLFTSIPKLSQPNI